MIKRKAEALKNVCGSTIKTCAKVGLGALVIGTVCALVQDGCERREQRKLNASK